LKPELVSLRGWTRCHAVLLMIAAGLSLLLDSLLPPTLVGVLSLLFLIFRHRGQWTTTGVFGSANMVTTLRLFMVAGLCAIGFARGVGPAAAVLVATIFALDGLDGWLAKRTGQSSAFGAAFDMECDALLVLVCTLLMYLHGRLGAYILIPGLLRYVYALALIWLPERDGEAPRSRIGRFVFSLFAVSMVVSLWPVEPLHRPLEVLATVFVVWSFARSALWYLKDPKPEHSSEATAPVPRTSPD